MRARERPFLKKSPLPRAPFSKDVALWAEPGGEAASLREAPLPPRPLSPEERLAFRLVPFLRDRFSQRDESWARFPAGWSRSRRLTEPPRPCGVRGILSLAADSSLCGGSLWMSAAETPSFKTGRAERLQTRSALPGVAPFHPNLTAPGRGGSVSRRDLDQLTGNRAQLSGGTDSVVAAPSDASCSSGEGVGGEALLSREAASPPGSPGSLKHPLFVHKDEGEEGAVDADAHDDPETGAGLGEKEPSNVWHCPRERK